jgi:hypothetical protein
MNYASSVAERTISVVDIILSRAMAYAWTSTYRDAVGGYRQQPPAEEDFGGGDFCSLEASPSTEDDQPLD